MEAASKTLNLSPAVKNLLCVMMEESQCLADPKMESVDTAKSAVGGGVEVKEDVNRDPGQKRTIDSEQTISAKKAKTSNPCAGDVSPMFYYNLHRRRFSHVDVPKYVYGPVSRTRGPGALMSCLTFCQMKLTYTCSFMDNGNM